MSRVGLIAVVFSVLIWIIINKYYKNVISIISSVVVVIPSFFLFKNHLSSNIFYVFERFAQIGNEAGSNGRLYLWSFFGDVFYRSPLFGCGAGNAITSMRELGYDRGEDNVHNYFFQVLLDFGVLGFALLSVLFIRYLRNKDIPVELRYYVGLYLLLSFVQFRGAEPLLFFILALGFLAEKSNNNYNRDCNVGKVFSRT